MRNCCNLAFTLCIVLAPADAMRGESSSGPVMETVQFRPLPGLTVADFLAAARATQAPLSAQAGFVRRALVQDGNGTWTDIVEWHSMAEATRAAEAMMAEPAFGPFMAAVDGASVKMQHLPILWQMGN